MGMGLHENNKSNHTIVLQGFIDDDIPVRITGTIEVGEMVYTFHELDNDAKSSYAITSDDSFLYVGKIYGLLIYDISGATLSLVANDIVNVRSPFFVSKTSTYLYVQDYHDSNYRLKAFSWDGTTLTYLTEVIIPKSFSMDADDNYIYVSYRDSGASTCYLQAYTFDGTNFTLVQTLNMGNTYKQNMHVTDGYIFVVTSFFGFSIYTFDGINFTLVDSADDVTVSYDLCYDSVNKNIFVTDGSGDKVLLYDFDTVGGTVTLLDTIARTDAYKCTFHDGVVCVTSLSDRDTKIYKNNAGTLELVGTNYFTTSREITSDTNYVYIGFTSKIGMYTLQSIPVYNAYKTTLFW